METINEINQAEVAAKEALEAVFQCIVERKSFILEAGAGAGKTYSLVHALRFLIRSSAREMLRNRQQIACITYTNVASNEITSRTDSHPVVFSATIHAFCWSLMKSYQAELRKLIPTIGRWPARLVEAEIKEIGLRNVHYDLGQAVLKENDVWISHNNVLELFVELIKFPKFRTLLIDRYPIIFIDEYQDTERTIVDAIKTYFLDTASGPLFGFFGDHWQKIYGNGCGKVDHTGLKVIGKKANFRSAKEIVDCLNKIRPELPQLANDTETVAEITVYHTNDWKGERLKGPHWAGDLPADVSHTFLEKVITDLSKSGWDFSPGKSKILMLTHKVLASEQGYRNIADHFSYTDQYIKKEDPYIAFFVDIAEPAFNAYSNQRYGEMFTILDCRTVKINSHADKLSWSKDMNVFATLRQSGTIGNVLDYLKKSQRPRLPEKIETIERELEIAESNPDEAIPESAKITKRFRNISYQEIIALTNYHTEHSPFSTKHGVKGAEFENVLVVVGRGWSQYNFNTMLERALRGVPHDKQESFEQNRNLFYVACSRPKRRLAILFTQELSSDALTILGSWFGTKSIQSVTV